MAMIERVCTHCGKTIQVPEELTVFSCVYCGGKMELAPKTVPIGESVEADHLAVLEHLLDGIRDNPKYFVKNFTKKSYEPSFFQYKREREDTYAAMERYLLANPDRRESLLEQYTERFLEDWEALRQKRRGQAAAFSDKMTLALYEVPAILSMELNCGRDYVNLLHEKFVRKYPDNIFEPGTYEELAAGFERKKLCFITTAVCEFEGKPDDCAELTAFRNFRDGWLTEQGDEKLIREYYEIAPSIVTAIDYCDDRAGQYAAIRRDYLTPCYAALKRKDMPGCREKYVEMVRMLQKKYLS